MTERHEPQLKVAEGREPQSLSVSHTEVFSGPLPPPAVLAKYDAIVPGAAERIIAMAENQSAHRITMESHVIHSDIQNSRRGQLFGFIIAIVGLVSSFILVVTGHEVVGGILGGTTLVSLVGVFVYGTTSRKHERQKKEEESQETLPSVKIHNAE